MEILRYSNEDPQQEKQESVQELEENSPRPMKMAAQSHTVRSSSDMSISSMKCDYANLIL